MLKKLLVISAFLLGTYAISSSAHAADERFAVDVNVDVTDSNASLARERAMNEANRAAIVEVAKRITTTEGAIRLGSMTDEQLINFIKEVSVNSEKSSNIRYIASLRVVLHENMLRQYMEERQIPLLADNDSRILIIPIFREFENDKPLLWEGGNLWRLAWENSSGNNSVKFIPLAASGTNYMLIDANKAAAADGEALNKLMMVNGTDDVYVLDAVYDGIEGLIIQATSYKGNHQTIKVAGDRSSGIELFKNAVAETKLKLEQQYQEQNLQENNKENVQTVVFDFHTLSEWIRTEQLLRKLPGVQDIETQAMGTNRIQFNLVFNGSLDKLLYALREKSYTLTDTGSYAVLEKL